MAIVSAVSLWLLSAIASPPIVPTPSEMNQVKSRFTTHVTDNSTSTENAGTHWASLLKPDGSWGDIDYKDESRGAWKAFAHMGRVVVMSQSLYGHPNHTLALATVKSLQFWLTNDFKDPNWWFATIGIPVDLATIVFMFDGSGFASELDATARAQVLTLMQRSGYADNTKWTGANLADVMKVQVARGLVFNNASAVATGFARVWEELYWSKATDDNIQRDGSFHQHSEEGIRGALLAGSYGTVFTTDMLGFVDLAYNTTLALDSERAAIFASLLLDGQRWMITPNKQWDWSVVGRGNSGPTSFSVNAFGNNAQYMHELAVPERSQDLKSFSDCLTSTTPLPCADAVVGNRHFFDSDYHVHRRRDWMVTVRMYSNRTIAARCVNAQGKRNSREADGVTNLYVSNGTYAYKDVFPVWDFHKVAGMSSEIDIPLLPCVDADDYSRWVDVMNYTEWVGGASDGVYGTAAMNLSSRTLHVENGWFFNDRGYVHVGSGLRCSSTSDVITSLANHLFENKNNNNENKNKTEYENNHKTKNETKTKYTNKNGTENKNENDMVIENENENEVVVMMGGKVVTLPKGNHSMPNADVDWVWVGQSGGNGTAYIPLGPQWGSDTSTLQINNDMRTGSWSALGTSTGTISRNMFELFLDHGNCDAIAKAGSATTFAYGVVPTILQADVEAVTLTQAWTLVSNTEELQAVAFEHTSAGVASSHVQAVFRDPLSQLKSPSWEITTSAPAIVMAHRSHTIVGGVGDVGDDVGDGDGDVVVTVSSPLATVREVVVTIDGHYSGKNCSYVSAANATRVMFVLATGDFRGASITTTCAYVNDGGGGGGVDIGY